MINEFWELLSGTASPFYNPGVIFQRAVSVWCLFIRFHPKDGVSLMRLISLTHPYFCWLYGEQALNRDNRRKPRFAPGWMARVLDAPPQPLEHWVERGYWVCNTIHISQTYVSIYSLKRYTWPLWSLPHILPVYTSSAPTRATHKKDPDVFIYNSDI